MRLFIERELDERLATPVDEPGQPGPRRNRGSAREDRTEEVAVELPAGGHHQPEPAAATHRRPVAVGGAHRVGSTGGEHRRSTGDAAEVGGQPTVGIVESFAVVDRDQRVLIERAVVFHGGAVPLDER